MKVTLVAVAKHVLRVTNMLPFHTLGPRKWKPLAFR
jgi:hypothetical protein